MLVYYPSQSSDFLEEICDTFQVSKTMAVFMDMHISSCGLVALPICFTPNDEQSLENYRFLMTERRTRAKDETLKLFKLISRHEVDNLDLPVFEPEKEAFRRMQKTGKFTIRTSRKNNGPSSATVLASVSDTTTKLSFFSEVSRSTSRQCERQPKSPKSGTPKQLFKLFGKGKIFEKNNFSQFICQGVVIPEAHLFESILEEDRFFRPLTWNRIDSFLCGKLDDLFSWPDLDYCSPDDLHAGSEAQFEEKGLFEIIKYRVGTYTSSSANRRVQLGNFIENGITPANTACSKYWKEEDKVERLRKLALKIAMHIRMSRAKAGADFSLAISHWTEDLEWLRNQYYEPLKNPFFDWPSI